MSSTWRVAARPSPALVFTGARQAGRITVFAFKNLSLRELSLAEAASWRHLRNLADLARDVGISVATARGWLPV